MSFLSIRNMGFVLLLLVVMVPYYACNKNDISNPSSNPNNFKQPDTLINGKLIFNTTPDSATQSEVTIYAQKSSPCYPSNEVYFFSVSAPNLSNASTVYTWTIEEGQFKTTVLGKKAQHIYSRACTSIVKVELSNNGNVVGVGSITVYPAGQQSNNQQVGFEVTYITTTNKNFLSFASQAQNPGDGYINALYWDFADGQNDSRKYVQHSFPSLPYDKDYWVRLYVNNNWGCKDSVVKQVPVPASYSLPCRFSYSSKDVCTTSGEVFTFVADTTGVPSGAQYVWDFKDYSTHQIGNLINHKYANPNSYDVELKIVYKGNFICADTTRIYAKGQDAVPTAFMTGQPESADSTEWFFNDLSVFRNGGFLDDIFWDYGDGHTAHPSQYSPNPPNHVFASGPVRQIFKVKMVITAHSGCKDSCYYPAVVPAK